MPAVHRRLLVALSFIVSALAASSAHAFCGFYVGKTDGMLLNDSSQVVLARDGDRTVVTLSNNFKGDMKEFAMVVPVPVVLKREQIHIGTREALDHLAAYSQPRLVEYYDSDPCEPVRYKAMASMGAVGRGAPARAPSAMEKKTDLGVTIEAQYSIGEYDILLLSATQSAGLQTWLQQEGYRIPPRASAALEPYIKQDMKFFVAKVNLKNQQAGGFDYLRPIQVAYESPKFMLPIRLGMANAQGPQDMIVMTLTRQGRVESTNYRTTFMPTGENIPEYVQSQFSKFYKSAFDVAYRKGDMRSVLTEYAWSMGNCDPCSAQPLTPDELRGLGAFWVNERNSSPWGGSPVYLTRLHVRYDSDHFPEDLVLQVTGDTRQYQARYVMQHPANVTADSCSAAEPYLRQVHERHEQEAKTLASLTGWNAATIRQQMHLGDYVEDPWYRRMWK